MTMTIFKKLSGGNSIPRILSTVDNLVAQLEAAVSVEEARLSALRDELVVRNANVDRAYKAIHNISSLTA